MAYGDLAILYRMAQADLSFDINSESETVARSVARMGSLAILSYHTANVAFWRGKIGQVTGTGRFRCQCANLVQTATNLGPTKEWIKGPKVKGNTAVPPGTIIAAGWVDGKYLSSPEGNTAAIFLEHTRRGSIKALHQWKDRETGEEHPVYIDTFGLTGEGYLAEEFYVVLTIRRINDMDWSHAQV
jgi:hypothetical protein